MIGDTAAISLLTGLPGSGKSLRCVQRIAQLVEKGEHVFVCNLNGIKVPGISTWDDPLKWEQLPKGAILFVDEAQHFFPARRAGEPHPAVRALSTIRHLGVRLVLVTQQPDFLDSYVRGLVGFHEHLYRTSGKSNTFIFRNNQVMENVRLPFKRIKNTYDHEKWSLPEKYFAYYTSAELHTMKYRMPALLRRVLIILPIAALMFGVSGYLVFQDTMFAKKEAEPAGSGGATSAPAAADDAPPGAENAKKPRTVEQYAQEQVPRLANAPWSAPVFDDVNRASAKPELFCAASEAGLGADGQHLEESCSCITEQGTRYVLTEKDCNHVSRYGQAYNPYKEPDPTHTVQQPQQPGEREVKPKTSAQSPRVASAATGVLFGELHHYGALELAKGKK
ncbi:MAG TPA: zonular occludens toxin domain-containing protein [Xanthomonadaceae bacterium]